MGLTRGPDGQMTTTFRLEQDELHRQRQGRVRELDGQLVLDAINWRVLVDKIGVAAAEELIADKKPRRVGRGL